MERDTRAAPFQRRRWYVGVGKTTGCYVAFATRIIPNWNLTGTIYGAIIGPFATRRGARFMARSGRGNPHLQTVADAERIAKKYAGGKNDARD